MWSYLDIFIIKEKSLIPRFHFQSQSGQYFNEILIKLNGKMIHNVYGNYHRWVVDEKFQASLEELV